MVNRVKVKLSNTDLEAMTLSSLRIKVVISSGVIPMAAAAVKYGVSVLSQ